MWDNSGVRGGTRREGNLEFFFHMQLYDFLTLLPRNVSQKEAL